VVEGVVEGVNDGEAEEDEFFVVAVVAVAVAVVAVAVVAVAVFVPVFVVFVVFVVEECKSSTLLTSFSLTAVFAIIICATSG
jgi:hypothetical protein